MSSRPWIVLVSCLLLTIPAFADFHYQEKTTITGGALVGMIKFAGAFNKAAKQGLEPITSDVLVKGNRMARITPERTEIIDLDKGTITQIDHQKKQYTVMTFEQMKQQMEEAQRQAAERQAKQAGRHSEPAGTPPPQMEFKVNVRNTGTAKQVSGLSTHESILSLALEQTDTQTGQKGALAFTDDLWLAPDIPGYAEVRDFNRRLAEKMGMIFGDALRPSMAAMQPGSAQGMAKMTEQTSKLKGVPMLQVMRMGVTANGQPLPAASEAPLPPSNGPEMPSAGEVAKKSAASAVTSHLGFGGFGLGRKKKQEQPEENASQKEQGKQQTPQQSVLLETNTEIISFSPAPIADSQFAVPAGYQQISPETERMAVQH